VVSEDVNAWICPYCSVHLETLSPIFLNCDLAKFLWSLSPWSFNISFFSSKPITKWILAIIYPSNRLGIPIFESRKFQLLVATVLDLIWLSRNKVIHEAIGLI
jgi:hypothetical protein